MRKIPFTQKCLDLLSCNERTFFADKDNKYLVVRVSKDRKVFYYQRRFNGTYYCVSIGEYPVVSIAFARGKASRFSADLLNGIDIRIPRGAVTFGEMFSRYIENHAKPNKRSWQDDVRLYESNLTGWASSPIDKILPRELAKSKAKMKDTPVLFNRLRSLVSKVFSYAADIEGLAVPNPALTVQKYPEKSRERNLSEREVATLLNTLDALCSGDDGDEWLDTRDVIKVLLFTGQRKSNVMAMKWKDLDLDSGIWTIDASEFKGKRTHTVPLPSMVVELVRNRENASAFVFPSDTANSGHIQSIQKRWDKLLEISGLRDVHLHDLRRTMGSWQVNRGDSMAVIAKNLGHSSVRVTEKVYAHVALDPIRESVQGAADAMINACSTFG